MILLRGHRGLHGWPEGCHTSWDSTGCRRSEVLNVERAGRGGREGGIGDKFM